VRKVLKSRVNRVKLAASGAAVLAVLGLTGMPADAAEEPTFRYLNPGGQPSLVEKVPVNIVFIGYEESGDPAGRNVPRASFLSGLPAQYEPVVRSRLPYGIVEKLGLTYTYEYKVRYADAAYENTFFAKLVSLAKSKPLIEAQTAYNAQATNIRTVGSNYQIDAPSVEKWLAQNPPSGIDTRRDTVYLINWFGRSDFRHHVYAKTNEKDPDTNANFGNLDSRKMSAWGGTTADDEENGLGSTARVWFHDLSAGPEEWTFNFNVDDADVDGDGEADYRLPPVWEYVAGGDRAPSILAADLARLTRYVALNLLFTTSPLYPVELPKPAPPKSINIDSNTYEGWSGVNASASYITTALLLDELSELRWRNTLNYDTQDLPYSGKARDCYQKLLQNVSCYPASGFPPFANLFLQNQEELARTQDDQGTVDYELPVFNYAVNDDVPALGFADDNYTDGTQSFVFAFVSPAIVNAGYGLTTTLIHEVGHHLGLSHPHDGYDSATGVDYGPTGDFMYVNAGDWSNSMMSYIDLNWDFSQFDRDNSDRFLAAAYNEEANALAQAVLADDQADTVLADLRAADGLLGSAQLALTKHSYRGAYDQAAKAYEKVVAAAKKVGVSVATVTAMRARTAAADRRAGVVHDPHEFIDTLAPDSPRAQD
jgi:hypothetical protein